LREANGTITSFDPPGSVDTSPVSINNAGAIAGHYNTADGGGHGFVRHPSGQFTSFDAPNGFPIFVSSMNNSGDITGFFYTDGLRRIGFVRHAAGTITSFDQDNYTNPTSINDHGVIVGSTSNLTFGFVRSPGGTFTRLGPPDFCISGFQPISINEAGVIAGSCAASIGPSFFETGWVRFP
jgi:hypothetical protein